MAVAFNPTKFRNSIGTTVRPGGTKAQGPSPTHPAGPIIGSD